MNKRSMEPTENPLRVLKAELLDHYVRLETLFHIKSACTEALVTQPEEGVWWCWRTVRVKRNKSTKHGAHRFALQLSYLFCPLDFMKEEFKLYKDRTISLSQEIWLCNARNAQRVQDTRVSQQAKPHLQAYLPPDLAGLVDGYLLRHWEREFQLLFDQAREGHKKRKS